MVGCFVVALMRMKMMMMKILVQRQRHSVRRSDDSRIMPENGMFTFNIQP